MFTNISDFLRVNFLANDIAFRLVEKSRSEFLWTNQNSGLNNLLKS